MYICSMQVKIAKMQIKTIKQHFMSAMRVEPSLRQKLATANNCSLFTIGQWIRKDNAILTTATNLEIIRDHFNLADTDELLEVEPITQ